MSVAGGSGMAREEYLERCKRRALAYLEAGRLEGAVGSMLSGVRKWEGGPLYAEPIIVALGGAAMAHLTKCWGGDAEAISRWIEGFS